MRQSKQEVAKTIALNAADEVAVAAFLEGAIGFQEIPATIKVVVGETSARVSLNLYQKYCRLTLMRVAGRVTACNAWFLETLVPQRLGRLGVSSPPSKRGIWNRFVIAVVSMAVVLGIMILVHEFGHYAAAKFFGVRVDVFSIGFGKRLVGFRRGDTDYRISALPLGGYVKMAGENPLEPRSGAPNEFMSHPRWQRFVIAIAGPAMNILLAIAILTGVFMVHYERPQFFDQPAVVGWVMDNSAASKAGIQPGDRIVRIEGVQNPTWEDVMLKVIVSPKQPVDIAIQRGNDDAGEAGAARGRRFGADRRHRMASRSAGDGNGA